MLAQTPDSPNCGPVSLCNALRCLGIFLSEEESKALCSTECDGTDEHDIMRALEVLGISHKELEKWDAISASLSLRKALLKGQPVIISTENYTHWVVVVGLIGDSFVVVDSDSTEITQIVQMKELCTTWRGSPEVAQSEALFYGIILTQN